MKIRGFRSIVLVQLLLTTLLTGLPCYAREDQVRPPKSVCVMMQFSTLSEMPIDEKVLMEKCRRGQLIRELKLSKGTQLRLVIPIFDDGHALYDTEIAPFAQRTLDARFNEICINQVLAEAKRRGVQVFLGFDVLGWQKAPRDGWDAAKMPGIFDSSPELEELTKDLESATLTTRFASPWSPAVRNSLSALVAEAARRFPLASGVVLDVHLSRGEIMGFGAQARLAARREIHLDPVDLNIQGTAEEKLSDSGTVWIQWRNKFLRDFVWSLAKDWREAHDRANPTEVWISGDAGYDATPGFDTLRSGQNAIDWINSAPLFQNGSLITGGLLEGHWQSSDSSRWKRLEVDTSKHVLVPVMNPTIEAMPHSLAEDWVTLETQTGTDSAGILVNSRASDEEAVAFLAGRGRLPQRPPLEIGSIVPSVTFYNSERDQWTFRELFNHKAAVLLNLNVKISTHLPQEWTESLQILEKLGQEPALNGTVFGVVAPTSVTVPSRSSGTEKKYSPFVLTDPRRDWLSRCPDGISLVSIDEAGFVRAVKPLKNDASIPTTIQAVSQSPQVFAEGSPAPDFVVTDMNGQVRHLAALRGNKALILSFFPKCFTGACANHMASLNSEYDAFTSAGIEVLGVSIDGADVQRDFAKRWSLRFPLVPDTGRNLCALYGAAADAEALASRQTVFIDKYGIVRFIDRQVKVSTHGQDILQRLQDLGLAK